MNHRDTMDTEKNPDSPDEIRSPIDGFSEHTPALVFPGVHRVSVVYSAAFTE